MIQGLWGVGIVGLRDQGYPLTLRFKDAILRTPFVQSL